VVGIPQVTLYSLVKVLDRSRHSLLAKNRPDAGRSAELHQ